MQTQLDIYVDTELLNPRILIVKEASYYNPDDEVTGGVMDIKYPGSDDVLYFDVATGFTEIINSNTIGMTTSCSENLGDLPDGIWEIKYSIYPYADNFVELTYLRNTLQKIKYVNAYCSLDLNKCTKSAYNSKFEELRSIWNFIKAAEYSAYCCKYDTAIKMYNIAEAMLDKFTGDCNCK